MEETQRRMGEESQKMIQALDKNGDGFIEREDLRQLLFQLGISRDIMAIFNKEDVDHDGLIRIEEFVEWLLEDAPAAAARQMKLYPKRVNDISSPRSPDSSEPEVASKVINCSQWFAQALVDAGVTHVYGGHGGALVPMVNAVVEHPKLTWICTRNEANASLMAAAHAKLTGGLSCCIATSGPGATNLTTGLIEADLDQCSVIALTGLKPRQGLGYSEFQDVNQARLFAGGSLSFSENVASTEAFVPMLRNAVARAITTRCCVHLAVPVDIQASVCPVPYMPLAAVDTLTQIRALHADTQQINAVAAELQEATSGGRGKVLIAVGHRCVAAGPEILRLAEKLHAPVLTRLDAKGSCNESHPLVWGVMGVHGKPGLEASARLIESCELVLAFGVHDYSVILCNQAGMQVRPMIVFEPDAAMPINSCYQALHTVIGYTPHVISAIMEKMRDMNRGKLAVRASFRTSLAHMTSKQSPGSRRASQAQLPSLAEMCESATKQSSKKNGEAWSLPSSPAFARKDTDDTAENTDPEPEMGPEEKKNESTEIHLEEVDYWELLSKARKQKSWREILASKEFLHIGRYEVDNYMDHEHCHPAKVFEEMNKHFGPNDVLCVDTGDVTLWAGLCAVLSKGQRTLSSERLGTMGYSLVAGFVACLVREDMGRGVVVAGDGGIQMTINELGTVCQVFQNSTIPYRLLIVVFDNAMLGRVHFGFKGAQGCELGPSPDFVGLVKAYGGDGALLSDETEIEEVVAKAFASEGIYMIHCLVDPSIRADMTAFKDKSIQMMSSG
uniref:EF-hand domain-containing protein n=1 Tax=Alexandrium monilatum TaxID=311494 RepID=A0A7S4QXK0_9DINO